MYGQPDDKDKGWELIDNVMAEGWYKLAVGEKLGHYHIEDASESGIVTTTSLDDGELELYAGQLEDKRKFQIDAFREATKATAQALNDTGIFEDVLKQVLESASRAARSAEEGSDGSHDPSEDEEEISDDDLALCDDDDDCFGAAVGAGVFGGPPRKAVAKATPRGGAPASSASQAVRGLGSPAAPASRVVSPGAPPAFRAAPKAQAHPAVLP